MEKEPLSAADIAAVTDIPVMAMVTVTDLAAVRGFG